MDYLIRPMEHRDLERVLGIISRHDEEDEEYAREFFKRYFNDEVREVHEGRQYVIEIEEDLVATGGYLPNSDTGHFWVAFLFVDPYFQGQRLGSRLLERLCDDVASLGGKELYVSIHAKDIPRQAVRFYEVNGFVRLNDEIPPPVHPSTNFKVYRKKLSATTAD